MTAAVQSRAQSFKLPFPGKVTLDTMPTMPAQEAPAKRRRFMRRG